MPTENGNGRAKKDLPKPHVPLSIEGMFIILYVSTLYVNRRLQQVTFLLNLYK